MGLLCRGDRSQGSWGFWSTKSCPHPPRPSPCKSHSSAPVAGGLPVGARWHTGAQGLAQESLWFSGQRGLACPRVSQATTGRAVKLKYYPGLAGAAKIRGLELLLTTPVFVPLSSDVQGLGMAPVSGRRRRRPGETVCPSSGLGEREVGLAGVGLSTGRGAVS